MSAILLIVVIWGGAMLLFVGVMVAMVRLSRHADEQQARLENEAAATAVELPPVELGGRVGVSVQEPRVVLQACRECLSVVTGGHETCPACGGALVPTHVLGADEPAWSDEAGRTDEPARPPGNSTQG
jgi:hypothetical protein